jgi:hypothetical protein
MDRNRQMCRGSHRSLSDIQYLLDDRPFRERFPTLAAVAKDSRPLKEVYPDCKILIA